MEGFDDDFGELYAGVEAQASSAIIGVSDFAKFYTEPEVDVNDDDNKAKNAQFISGEGFVSDSKKPDSVTDELGDKVLGLEANDEDDNGSDSEDDLKIVLNDEDCEGTMFPIAGRRSMKSDEHEDEEYKYVRTQGSACPSNSKANEAVGLVSSMLVRGDRDNNMCNQHKGSSSRSTCMCDTPNPVVIQTRCGFRLPWYRTILDVNIKSFEEKAWRYPGVDITDYFNFGMNEDSWKQYCNSLEQLRLKSMQCGIPVSDASKFYQAKEAGSQYEKFAQGTIFKEMNHAGPRALAPPSSTVSDSRVRQLDLPKGRAIQIEDSIVERQPSFDGWHLRSLDSDVVIQISVQDTEETSNSGEEQGCANGTAHEASENEEFDTNDNRFIAVKEDDLLIGAPGGKTRRLDRHSQKISVSHPITIDNHGNKQVIGLDGNDHTQANDISLGTTGIENKTKKSVGRNTFYADECMMEPQLSLGDDNQLSPTLSCFASDSEASKNSVHFDPEDIHTPVRPSVKPHTERCESVTSSIKNSKSNGIKRKLVGIKDHSTRNSPAQKELKHQDRRLNSIVEAKFRTKYYSDVFPISETEDLYDRDSSLNSCSQKKRLGESSHYEESNHYSIRYADNNVHTAKTNYLNRKGSHMFQDKLDPYVRKTWNEREFFCEDRGTDRHCFGRTQFTKERSPLPSRESRGRHSRYSSHAVEERDARPRRNGNKLHFKKMPNHSGGFFDYKHEDHFMGEKFGRCVSFTDQKRNTLDEFDERQFPLVRRELKNSGGRGGYVDSPGLDWDDSCSGKTEDEYCRHRENQYLSHQSYRKLYTADEGRWNGSLSPRNDVSLSRTTDERYWRHARKIYSAEAKESNWFDCLYDADEIDDIIYPIDHFKWRRFNLQSEVVHWTDDQLTVRHHGDKLYSEKKSCSYRKYVRHEKFRAKYGSSYNAMHIDHMLPEQHRFKMMRKGSSANCINGSSKMYNGKLEQTVLSCRDSNDLVVGERKVKLGEPKSSGRSFKGRTLMCNARLENMDPEIGGEQTTLVDSSETEKLRAVQFNTSKVGCNQNNEKGLEKFPVIAPNGDLDIEEGQIVIELNTTHLLRRKHASEYSASAHNVKRRIFDGENAFDGNKVVEGYDNQRILETMAKMEKRGERFKAPIILKKEPDKLSKTETDLVVETKDHRPARKRQWGGI